MTRCFRVDRQAVRTRLTDWAQEVGRRPEVLGVLLFGSFARGDATAASDADLVIIVRDSSLRFHDRIPVYKPSRLGVSVDVFPYTLSEVQQSLQEGWGIVPVAMREGRWLYRHPEIESLRTTACVLL